MKTNWYKNAFIYQIYPRSFKDSNDDGLGDIKGIISKLDYLSLLGINAIWLSPIYDSPQEDNGYDISDYYHVYPPFGNIDDLKSLIEKAHSLNIKIIMDLVINHTSTKHKYFQDIINNPSSEYKDYYIIKKGRCNGKKPPNNWTGFFGEKAWEKLPNSDSEYYLHLFAKGQADINWENDIVREKIKKMLTYYFDLGVDGFRCDVITLISKNQEYKSRFPRLFLTGKNDYINGPRLHEYLKELNKDVFSKYDSFIVGESVLSSLEDIKQLTNPNNHELDAMFNFKHTDIDNYLGVKWFKRRFSLRRWKKTFNKYQVGLDKDAWNTLFIENHDQRRSAGRFNTNEDNITSLKMLATTYTLMKGTTFIYQGQEIGMKNPHFSSLKEFRDVETFNIYNLRKKIWPLKAILSKKHLFEYSRDNARTPMIWDDSLFGGFSSVTPWINMNNDKSRNVKDALNDEDSLFYFYQSLISLKKDNETLINGKFVLLDKNNPSIFSYLRKGEKEDYLIISNFKNKNTKYSLLKELKNNDIILSNYKDYKDYLRPYESRVYKIKHEKEA